MTILLMSRRLIHGFGVNDSDYATQSLSNGVKCVCPAYAAWKAMIHRVYSKRSLAVNPCYEGVVVCEEWRSFMSFRDWWLENHVTGWHLDKDIVGRGNIYSPDDCIFIPPWINTLMSDVASKRGDYLIGVTKVGNRYRANCRHPFNKIKRHIGYFETEIEAHERWVERKIEVINDLKCEMDAIDLRIYDSLLVKIKKAR
ncbi:MAG: hypothetical protein ACRCXB_27920 [Aeromonadaceae bacterium]